MAPAVGVCFFYGVKNEKKWTEDEENKLRELLHQRLEHKEISVILNRSEKSIALKCFRLKIRKNIISLQDRYPEIAKELHPTKNTITANDIEYSSNVPIWWKCKFGHEWKMSPNRRTASKNNCPFCSNKRILEGFNDISTTHPELLSEWDFDKNIIKPTEISFGSSKKVWWKCILGHSWDMSICSRTRDEKCGCPYCANPPQRILMGFNDLASKRPDICEEWDYEKNDFLPSEIAQYSTYIVWFLCEKKHSYSVLLSSKTFNNFGCPICSNKRVLSGYNDIATTHQYLLNEWDYEKNTVLPTEVSYGSSKKIWWKCNLGHSYNQTIPCKISQHQGCPYCINKKILIGYNDIWTTHPKLCEELVNKDDGLKVSCGSEKKINWQCKKCNHIYCSSVKSRATNNTGCPKCNQSHGEKKVEQILKKYNIEFDYQKRFDECRYKNELPFDFYLPDYNTCVEYQGEQHYSEHNNILHPKGTRHDKHSLLFIKQKDDIKKNFCQNRNIRLIEIPYWEFKNIEDIIVNELNILI